MLKIIKHPEFVATVTLDTLALKGDFDVRYRALGTEELTDAEMRIKQEGRSPQDLLFEVVRGFDDVELYGEPLVCRDGDAAPLRRLLDVPGVGAAMLRRYYTALWNNASGN